LKESVCVSEPSITELGWGGSQVKTSDQVPTQLKSKCSSLQNYKYVITADASTPTALGPAVMISITLSLSPPSSTTLRLSKVSSHGSFISWRATSFWTYWKLEPGLLHWLVTTGSRWTEHSHTVQTNQRQLAGITWVSNVHLYTCTACPPVCTVTQTNTGHGGQPQSCLLQVIPAGWGWAGSD